MSDVKPALSPEQWDGARVDGPWNGTQLGPDIYVDPADGKLRATSRGWIENHHGLAALALHGQPYGFTWEDVKLVQMWIDAKKHSDQLGGFVARMEGFRDRIAALLPPREEP